MTAKLLQIKSYTRRAPVDRYAAIREAKTEQLFREVNDHVGAMLVDALALMDVDDIQRARIEETY